MKRGALAALAFLLLAGCSKPERIEAPERAPLHLAKEWFAYRAGSLGISVAACASRDAALPEEQPPAIDRPTALEAAAIFRAECALCHGKDGTPPAEQPGGGAPPHAWGTFGTRMGFFFGGDSMRAGLYRTIREGGKPTEGKASSMPAWGSVLSREQTWGLVRHFESF